MKINKTKLYESFTDIKNIANINIMVCYRVLFSKKGIENNIACFLITPIFLFHLVVVYIFYKKEILTINNKIEDITFGINHWDLIQADEEKKIY